jgi:alkylation response protein AidB-like acyl-CoA dehydrogenase
MDFKLTEAQQEWRDEVISFLEEAITPEFRADLRDSEGGEQYRSEGEKEFWKKVASRGWLGMNWPKEYGGLEMSAMDQLIMLREFARFGAPPLPLTVTSLVPTLIRFGTDENKREWIPQIAAGDAEFALGYSEPDSGTDLASLQTRAVLDGDEWVINGQKIWNTHGHVATHEWLAVRTDPTAPKHKGISVIIVPLDAPGVDVTPIWTWGDMRTNQVFFTDVRVPAGNLVGELNRGWYYIASALDLERVALGAFTAELDAMFDQLVTHFKTEILDGDLIANRASVRRELAAFRKDLEIASLFGLNTASMMDAGLVPNKEASMQKFYGSELRTRLTSWAMSVMGLSGQLLKGDAGAPLEGEVESSYRKAPPGRFGGGTNEVQRNIVAQRGLGMPRA